MHRLALVKATAAAFAPAPRPFRVGAPVSSRVRARPAGFRGVTVTPEFGRMGGMSVNAGLVSTVPGYVINLYLMTTAVARRCFGKVNFGASKWAPLAFFPVCVSLFLLSGVVNEKIKGQFEDENAKFRPVPPVPDTGC